MDIDYYIKYFKYYKKNYKLIFCLWIWIATFLYYFDFIKISFLYTSFFALIFTIFLQFYYYKRNLIFNISIIIFEIFIFYLNYKKHILIDKKSLINYKDLSINIILFIVYLIFLQILGTNFYEVYFSRVK